MATPSGANSSSANPTLPVTQVYLICALCLLVGLFVGYFWIGKHSAPPVAQTHTSPNVAPVPAAPRGGHPKLTLEQMKQMADVQASALIEKSKADPKNAALLLQIAGVYQATHQFKEASGYFQKALTIEPKNVSARTQFASCIYYSGDADGAIQQLNQALRIDPKDVNARFNLGMIKYRGKNDPAGAIEAWRELLKLHPNLDRKSDVEKLIDEAKAGPSPANQ